MYIKCYTTIKILIIPFTGTVVVVTFSICWKIKCNKRLSQKKVTIMILFWLLNKCKSQKMTVYFCDQGAALVTAITVPRIICM